MEENKQKLIKQITKNKEKENLKRLTQTETVPKTMWKW